MRHTLSEIATIMVNEQWLEHRDVRLVELRKI